ncbi:glycerol-3-phosphate 1-O-acyltransferase PlsY [Thermoanaerobacterium thermosaccharolyticum]|uniref:Glycerol-3-phosphate acyltransferase n=1 Tax=Thermoanaerobacterium thermosaccharolyticum M0795 TaxID=698948 RepID=L0IKK7_THETR|nr:glycerol-3-phosphate 1-O-acyltransferase PlsY [Thermoanaerobacterium thermosaccharolyticum]AGB19368.1 acyl-phosphate glycerol 3-phosphate acyltransferase [Thermoanaerobacterium thermosaccharolyticum M0795]
MIKIIIVAILSYLIGSFNSAYFFTNYIKKTDIRKYGSGNAGATNVMRVLGFKVAFLVFLSDALKGVLAVLLGRLIAGDLGGLIAGIAVVCGHNWPVFLGFKGGKGIATSFGAIISISPAIAILSLIIGIAIISISKYVSLGSILGAISFLLLNIIYYRSPNMLVFAIIITSLAVFQHRANIKRLLNGTESKLGQKTNIK